MSNRLRLGVLISLDDRIEENLTRVKDFGLDTCQLNTWEVYKVTPEMIEKIKDALKKTGVEITSLWTGYSGNVVWNFTEGPTTIGLVPPETRDARVKELKAGAVIAAKIGIKSITTHAGFIPENPGDPLYAGTIAGLREIAECCKENHIDFLFETGQETPVTLLRAIKDIGTDNLGINLDPANLLMYGKANPVDALDIIGPYVKGVHAKDGDYPTNPNELGHEKRMGDGKVNFPVLVPKLKSFGFSGALTIEREISGEQQNEDIRYAIKLLSPLC